jgi:hypothetical protein
MKIISKSGCNLKLIKMSNKKYFVEHEKSKYWSSKNKKNILDVAYKSNKKYLFECDICNHEFEKTITNITSKDSWCPYCANRKLCDDDKCDYCFNKSFASHEKAKYWSDVNEFSPRKVSLHSYVKCIFTCDKCNHEFESSALSINKSGDKNGCPYCSGKILCDDKYCKFCFNKSFASHEKAKYWSNKNKLLPRNVTKCSNLKYFFDCKECNHEIEVGLNRITCESNWCPYCASQKLCDNDDCKFCFVKSFASHEKAKYWSNKNKLLPRNIFLKSDKQCKFDCKECEHTFDMVMKNVTNHNQWCPYCNSRKLCDNKDCNFCFDKSFASSIKSFKWSNKNKLTPREFTFSSNNKAFFNCEECNHEFETAIANISTRNVNCPLCANKTEKKLHKWLTDRYKILYQVGYDWCINSETNKKFKFDFECEDFIIIELDGRQHREQIKNWTSPEITMERDKYKMQKVLENNKAIIRINQETVYYDKNNWEEKLLFLIKELLDKKIPVIKYIDIDESFYN